MSSHLDSIRQRLQTWRQQAALVKEAKPDPALRKELDAAAANTDTEPTRAQFRAGNYRKGRVNIHGLECVIENPVDSVRSGTTATGKAWRTVMKDHYGYVANFARSESDGDHMDCFIGPDPESHIVYVVDQYVGGKFDEHKCIIGALNEEQARDIYNRNYQRGWKGLRTITGLTIDQFKSWLAAGKTGKPLAGQEFKTFHKTASDELEKTAAAKLIEDRKRMVEETYQACPHCNVEWHEKGGPRPKRRKNDDGSASEEDFDELECPQCGGDVEYPETTDEEIAKMSPGFQEMMREGRERKRARKLKKQAAEGGITEDQVAEATAQLKEYRAACAKLDTDENKGHGTIKGSCGHVKRNCRCARRDSHNVITLSFPCEECGGPDVDEDFLREFKKRTKKAAAKTFQDEVNDAVASREFPADITFYVYKDQKCTVCWGDWHEKHQYEPALKLAKKWFNDVVGESECGKPEGTTEAIRPSDEARKAGKPLVHAVDLDGTLAKHDPNREFDPNHIGAPIPAMMAEVKQWIKDGDEVIIFTARAADPENIPQVKAWLKTHGLSGLKVTNEKTPDISKIHDDRAVTRELNTGKIIKAAASPAPAADLAPPALSPFTSWMIAHPGVPADVRNWFVEHSVSGKTDPDQMSAEEVGILGERYLAEEADNLPVEKWAAALPQAPDTGPEAIAYALANLDTTQLAAQAQADIRSGKVTRRPRAVQILNILAGLERNKLRPADLAITAVPVIPPVFRPFSVVGETFVPGDANELYRDLMKLRDVHGEVVDSLGPEEAGDLRLNIHDAVKALYGYGDPVSPKTKMRGASGFLRKITGVSPKYGWVQRKLLSKPMDSVGRGVLIINPELGLDQVGIPRDQGWSLFHPYTMRRLVQRGMKPAEALRAIKNRTPDAERALLEELPLRPVVYSRAPAWHRTNVIAGYAQLIDGDSIAINGLVGTGMNADHDGDTINVHVPSMPEAVKEAREKLMPSKMLFSIRDPDKVIPVPKHEQILGLFTSQVRPAMSSHDFPDEASAVAAIGAGRVRHSDNVTIAGK